MLAVYGPDEHQGLNLMNLANIGFQKHVINGHPVCLYNILVVAFIAISNSLF